MPQNMDSRYAKIYPPLKQALSKVLKEIVNPQEASSYHRKLTKIKSYDKYEKEELLQQRKQRDANYSKYQQTQDYDEDCNSDSDVEEGYQNLEHKQMQYLIRKKLLEMNMCPTLMEEVVFFEPLQDQKIESQLQLDSATDLIENQNENEGVQQMHQGEIMQREVNGVYQEEKNDKNLKALKLIIEELEKSLAKSK